MTSPVIPPSLAIGIEDACALSVEHWRLKRLGEQAGSGDEGASLRHAVRSIAAVLESLGISSLDFAGRTYDPGMAPEVVEAREDAGVFPGQAIVEETIAPTIMWNGHVVAPGQIVVKRSPAELQDSPRATE